MTSIDIPLGGKILLVTGGASGIGLSLVKKAHALGARVLIVDLHKNAEFDSFTSGKDDIVFVQADVCRWSEFNRIFDVCEQKWNDVPDAYAICAGIFEPSYSNFWQDPEEESYKSVDVNVSHPIKLTRLAIRKSLNKGKRATLCIIASVAGLTGNVAVPLYCATKHAMVGFVKSMRDSEPFTGVKVTALCPGAVYTPLFDSDKKKQFSLGNVGGLHPDDVADHMLALLEKKEYPCGSILEHTLTAIRLIADCYVPPPAVGTANVDPKEQELRFQTMITPVLQKLATEKGPDAKS